MVLFNKMVMKLQRAIQPRLPLLILFGFLLLFCGILGSGWLTQPPSFEELYGSIVRSGDFFSAAQSVGGWPWWTPNFLFGHSHALSTIALLPTAVENLLAFLLSPWLSQVASFKIFGLAVIFCSGISMFALSGRLLKSEWSGLFTAILYVTGASFVLRLAMLEHFSTASCMVFAPLILLAMLNCESRTSWRGALILALSVAAMMMCYFKIFLLFLPAGAVFFFWRLFSIPGGCRAHLVRGCLRGAVLAIPLALLPMIPILRESRFLALFELDPFAGWQQNYSFFSAITWLDWQNLLTRGTAIPALSPARHVSVEFYLGAVVLAGIFLPFALGANRPEWKGHPCRPVLRVFAALLLLATWLASGPRSIFGSHMAYLSGALGCVDFTISLVWAMLVAQGVLIYFLWGKGRIRIGLAIVSMLVYYFVPGFRLLEWIPLYQDIRAPSAIWTAFGSLSAVLAAGAGWSLLAALRVAGWKRAAFAGAATAFLALDVIFLHAAFFKPGLPAKTFEDYAAAQSFLAKAPLPGRVQALSGRYFYLTTPRDSGRPLASEALARHFQLRWIRYMEAGSTISPEITKAFFDLYGIAYILIDRQDPDTPQDYQDRFKKIFTTVFENDGFTILENPSTLYPAYEAGNIVKADADIFKNPGSVLLLGRGGLIAVEGYQGQAVGQVGLSGEPSVPGRAALEKAIDLKRLTLRSPRQQDFHSFVVGSLGASRSGIVVVTEAWHPDWKAVQDGRTLTVTRAVGGLLSVKPEGTGDITFVLSPPWYYAAGMTVWLAAWAAALLSFPVMRTGLAPASWKAAWYGRQEGSGE